MKDKKIKRINVRISSDDYEYLKNSINSLIYFKLDTKISAILYATC